MGGMAVRDGSLRLAGAVFSINCGAGRNTLADQAGPIRSTAICGDLGGVIGIGLIRFTGARVLQQVPVTL
jgi:hypothetical protein